jgi:hypothetical protein
MNQIQIFGKVCREPDFQRTILNNGAEGLSRETRLVTRLEIASYADGSPKPTFFKARVFGNCDLVEKIKKESLIAITGYMKPMSWVNHVSKERYSTMAVQVVTIHLLDDINGIIKISRQTAGGEQ